MKILWVSHLVPYPPKSGVLIRSHYLVKELAKYHELHLLALNQRGLIEPYFENYEVGTKRSIEYLSDYLKEIKIFDHPADGGKLKKLWLAFRSLFSRNPYTVNWAMTNQLSENLLSMNNEHQYDLIHFDTISFAPYINLIGGVTTCLDHHNVESHMLIRRADGERNWLKKWYYRQEGQRLKVIEQEACLSVDVNITCSELDSDRFKEFIPNANFVCIPNGVDTKYFYPGSHPPKPNRLIFIGTLDWYPNITAVRYLANKIWPVISGQFDDLELHIIGANPPEDLVKLGEIDKRVKVHGFVNDIIPELHAATIYVCPISDGGGTKLKLLDAFSSGKAVVAHPIACEGLNVTNGEHVLFAETVQEFSACIASLLKDEELRKKLETNCRLHVVENFSFEKIGERLAMLFTEINEK